MKANRSGAWNDRKADPAVKLACTRRLAVVATRGVEFFAKERGIAAKPEHPAYPLALLEQIAAGGTRTPDQYDEGYGVDLLLTLLEVLKILLMALLRQRTEAHAAEVRHFGLFLRVACHNA